jgi:hypothetical protein
MSSIPQMFSEREQSQRERILRQQREMCAQLAQVVAKLDKVAAAIDASPKRRALTSTCTVESATRAV